MSHQHFCQVAGHYWECQGKALRAGDTEPSTCTCLPCGLPVEGFDHSHCTDPVELLACPEHREEARRRTEAARKGNGRRAAKSQPDEGPADMASPIPEEPVRPFERFPLVPIGPDDPLWHCDSCCHCGCRRMPPELSGGVCLHCSHVYQRNDPEFWLGEEFPHSQAAHLKNCAGYQENCRKSEAAWAKFLAMSEGADDETFSRLLSACHSKAIGDNYEAYMSAPEGSPERAAIVDKIAIANAEETRARQQELDALLGERKGEAPPGKGPTKAHHE